MQLTCNVEFRAEKICKFKQILKQTLTFICAQCTSNLTQYEMRLTSLHRFPTATTVQRTF